MICNACVYLHTFSKLKCREENTIVPGQHFLCLIITKGMTYDWK